MLNSFELAFERVLSGLVWITAASIGAFAVLIPLNLALIKFGWGNFWWLHEAIEYALYVGVFIAAPWVLRQGAHVRVDVLLTALPPGAARRLEQGIDVAGASLCLLLAFYGARICLWEFEDGTLPDKDLRIPTGYMMLVFAASFVLLAVEFLCRLRRTDKSIASEVAASRESGL